MGSNKRTINLMWKELKACAIHQGYGAKIGNTYFVETPSSFDLRDILRKEILEASK